MTETARIVALVGSSVRNHPYIELSHAALERRDVSIEVRTQLPSRLARAIPPEVDAVHLHWPELMGYRSERPLIGAAATHVLGLRALDELGALRRSKTRFVWTAHDLLPHEMDYPRLERAIYRSAARADGVLAHSRFAAERLSQFEPRIGRIAIAPHGHFIGHYAPDVRDRDQIRAELDLPPDSYVYLLFGRYSALQANGGGGSRLQLDNRPLARLLVAGKAADEDEAREVRQAVAEDERVQLHSAMSRTTASRPTTRRPMP